MIIQEYFPISLFHGTNELFLGNIKRYGLNGFNQLEKYSLIEMLKKLVFNLEKRFPSNRTWGIHKMSSQKMIDQGNLSWKHFRTYLSCSKSTAETYATVNRYGSELLSRCIKLYELLESLSSVEEKDKILEIISPIQEIIDSNSIKPIVIKIDNVKAEALQPVDGFDMDMQLIELEKIKKRFGDDKLFEAAVGQINFIIKPGYVIHDFKVIHL